MRGIIQDSLFLVLLAGIASKANREIRDVGGQPGQAIQLGVDQGIHRANDNSPDAVAGRVVFEYVVNDGQEVGQTLV